MKLWGSLDWIFICLSTKFQLKIPSFAPRKALMSTQKKYVYSCQMGFGSECSLGGTWLPAPPGNWEDTRAWAMQAQCLYPYPLPTSLPPINRPSPRKFDAVGRHAGRMRPAAPGTNRGVMHVLCVLANPGSSLPRYYVAFRLFGHARCGRASGRPHAADPTPPGPAVCQRLLVLAKRNGACRGCLPWAMHTRHDHE